MPGLVSLVLTKNEGEGLTWEGKNLSDAGKIREVEIKEGQAEKEGKWV